MSSCRERAMTSVMAVVLVFSAIVLLSACASPVEGLWPPPDAGTKTIAVSLDTWHAVIAFPRENGTSESALGSQHTYYEEWGYAEHTWYLEGKTGMSGVVRALFCSTEGVVEVGHYDRLWAERTPQPPSELFTFRLTEEGYQRLRRHLHATLLSEEPVASFGQYVFYPAKRSCYLFHTCLQYAAHALRAACFTWMNFAIAPWQRHWRSSLGVIQAACFCIGPRSRGRSVASEPASGLIPSVAGYSVRRFSVA